MNKHTSDEKFNEDLAPEMTLEKKRAHYKFVFKKNLFAKQKLLPELKFDQPFFEFNLY